MCLHLARAMDDASHHVRPDAPQTSHAHQPSHDPNHNATKSTCLQDDIAESAACALGSIHLDCPGQPCGSIGCDRYASSEIEREPWLCEKHWEDLYISVSNMCTDWKSTQTVSDYNGEIALRLNEPVSFPGKANRGGYTKDNAASRFLSTQWR